MTTESALMKLDSDQESVGIELFSGLDLGL